MLGWDFEDSKVFVFEFFMLIFCGCGLYLWELFWWLLCNGFSVVGIIRFELVELELLILKILVFGILIIIFLGCFGRILLLNEGIGIYLCFFFGMLFCCVGNLDVLLSVFGIIVGGWV